MWNWFAAGGFGMFVVLAIGVVGLGYGAKSLLDPNRERLAVLRAFPGLIAAVGAFFFGVNMWAVNLALERGRFPPADKAAVGLFGVTEAAQALTLSAALAAAVLGLQLVASARHARAERAG